MKIKIKYFVIVIFSFLFFSCNKKTEPLKEKTIIVSKNPIFKEKFEEIKENMIYIPDTLYYFIDSAECKHANLSYNFDYVVSKKVFEVKTSKLESSYKDYIYFIIIKIIDKKTLEQQIIGFKSEYYYGSLFEDCEDVRSYETGYNLNRLVADNYFGDIVVADLNFDNKEDFAVLKNGGGNSGPPYNFYFQDSTGYFVKDTFLSEELGFFPLEINKENRTLTTYYNVGACGVRTEKYKYSVKKQKWQFLEECLVNICIED